MRVATQRHLLPRVIIAPHHGPIVVVVYRAHLLHVPRATEIPRRGGG
jgi:hypothetical protein